MSDRVSSSTRGRFEILSLLGVLLLAGALNLWNVGFPLGYHADEPVKIGVIKSGTDNFFHPLLLLQLVRSANLALGLSADQEIAVLGRSILALGAVVSVLLSHALARRTIGHLGALAVSLGVAVSPILVIHAHYLKEDTLLVTCLLGSLICFLMFVDRVSVRSSLWLGVITGLAFSSHYKALLLVPLYLAAPLLGALRTRTTPSPNSQRDQRITPSVFYRYLVLSGIVAASVFLLVNWPLVHEPQKFIDGVRFELNHALDGHDVRIGWSDYWLGFHLLHSLAPGMGWPALVVGLGGLLWILARWKQAVFQDRLLAAYVLLFYLVPEISPLKPAPDFARYILPIVPVLIYLAWRAVDWAAETIGDRAGVIARSTVALAAIALGVIPFYDTVRLASSMAHDTRARTTTWLQQSGGKALLEQYAGVSEDVRTATMIDLADARQQGVDFVVASSFMYERYFFGSQLPNQDFEIYRVHQKYIHLFKHPYVEIRPEYRSFGFSNPVIRIVDIRARQ